MRRGRLFGFRSRLARGVYPASRMGRLTMAHGMTYKPSHWAVCYGFSLVRGVELALLSGDAVFWAAGERIPNDGFNLSFIASLALVFAACALAAHKLRRDLPVWLSTRVAPIAITCGVCLHAANGLLSWAGWPSLCGAMAGTGSALMFLGWQEWFASSSETCDARLMGKSFLGPPSRLSPSSC